MRAMAVVIYSYSVMAAILDIQVKGVWTRTPGPRSSGTR